MKNEIGLMEENIDNLLGQQLHLEVEGEGVYDYEVAKLFRQGGALYLLATRLSEGREGYLMRLDDLGDHWWTLLDIEDDGEWEQARGASEWERFTTIVHREAERTGT